MTGTSGDDVIIVRPAYYRKIDGQLVPVDQRKRLIVVLNGTVIGNFLRSEVTGRVQVRGLAGNDQLRMNIFLANSADLYGGDGNDTIWGGSRGDRLFGDDGDDLIRARGGNDLVFGGNGNDTLHGGSRHDVLVGGAGSDSLQGSLGSDIIIGGTTDLTSTNIRLVNTMKPIKEWTSARLPGRSHKWRVQHLAIPPGGLNGTTFLNGATVHDDEAKDVLRGYYGLDWFLSSNSDQVVVPVGPLAKEVSTSV